MYEHLTNTHTIDAKTLPYLNSKSLIRITLMMTKYNLRTIYAMLPASTIITRIWQSNRRLNGSYLSLLAGWSIGSNLS